MFFTARRVIVVAVAVCIQFDSNFSQIMSIIYLNMFISMYQGWNRPMEVPLQNRIEYFNEFVIWLCTVLMMGFTDFIPDQETQLGIGWAMVTIITTLIAVGLAFVFYFGMKANILLYRKYRNRFDYWWLNFKEKFNN